MQNLNGGVNMVDLIEVVRDPMTTQPALIIQYAEHGEEDYRTLYKTFTDYDIRHYMFEILKALEYCHS